MMIAKGLMAMVACMAAAVTGQAGVMTWNPETRMMAFSAGDDKPWLSAGSAQIVLTGGQVISTSDKRFKVTFAEHRDSWVLSGVDEQKTLDWEMRIASVDQRSVRMDWTVFNRSTQALKLDQLGILSGKLEGQVDPANNRVIQSGLHSWDGGNVVRLVPGKKLESHYTLALQSPPFAAGFLAGRHNLDKFLLTQGPNGLDLKAYGECNQCVLPAGSARSADPLFLSGGGHPLRQMELFADLAARENGVQLWPENFATWCSWYAGWMRQESLFEFKSGLEKGVETNIPLVSKYITWIPNQGSLVGRVRGNGGEPTTLFFHVPAGMTCKAASLGYDPVAPIIVEPGVLSLEVPAVREDTIPFALQFTGTPVKPATRPFAAGPVGVVTP